MNKFKFLSLASIVLLVTNVILVGIILFGKPGHPKFAGPKNIIIEKLGFDENQKKEYDLLIEKHQAGIQKAEAEIKVLKNELYRTLTSGAETNVRDSLISQLGKQQEGIENLHYNHFLELKSICKESQLKSFESLTSELAALFSHTPKHRPKK